MDVPPAVVRAVDDDTVVAATLGSLPTPEAVLTAWRPGATAYVLADLGAPPGRDTVGVAVCGPIDGDGDSSLLAVVVRPRWPRAGPRVLGGAADAVRAQGGRRLVAREPWPGVSVAVLRAAGFRPDGGGAGDGRRLVLDL